MKIILQLLDSNRKPLLIDSTKLLQEATKVTLALKKIRGDERCDFIETIDPILKTLFYVLSDYYVTKGRSSFKKKIEDLVFKRLERYGFVEYYTGDGDLGFVAYGIPSKLKEYTFKK